MRIQLIAVGTRMPDWVNQGFAEYAGRLPREWNFQLHEIAIAKRSKNNDSTRLMRLEGEHLLARVATSARIIALDTAGQCWDTKTLAQYLARWMNEARDLALLIGGPDGLHQDVKNRAEIIWSLSPLTYPHALVRIVVTEQLYRAWSLLNNHPYHRA